MSAENRPTDRMVFVTGRLAAPLVRTMVESLADQVGFSGEVVELPISVAALMTTAWVGRRLSPPAGTTRILLPGHCGGDLQPLCEQFGCPVERGPKDIRQLPQFFQRGGAPPDLSRYDLEIIAEINNAPRLDRGTLLRAAEDTAQRGADIIDLGCDPGGGWRGVTDAVRALRDIGLRVSIDSWDPDEVAGAVAGGAELVLSVHRANREAAVDWGVEVVAVPDSPHELDSLFETAEWLAARGVPFRLDPILEPIGVGFAASLLRYHQTRQRFPEAEMMMGVGNVTELSDVDSAGVNFLLAAICQEWSIRSVLTTEVINWARSSVAELNVARRLAGYAQYNGVIPKHVDARLVMLRDAERLRFSIAELEGMASQIRDRNYRIFLSEEGLHLAGGGQHLQGNDPFDLFDQLAPENTGKLTTAHAFYLGYEMCKANIARLLDKNYTQDEALDWGLLTVAEPDRHRLRKKS